MKGLKIKRADWLILTWSFLVVYQLALLWNNLIPDFRNSHFITEGLVCTCPDAKVVKGKEYLISNTPDSLKKFNLDYSEIYFTQRPGSFLDYQESGRYIVYGEIIGKRRVSDMDTWNPLIAVKSFKEDDIFFDNLLRTIIILQIIVLIIIIKQRKFRVNE
ncbi:MAG: hypothetical protein ACK4ND_04325 [Cytophagaceae bacterium]